MGGADNERERDPLKGAKVDKITHQEIKGKGTEADEEEIKLKTFSLRADLQTVQ